MVSVIKEIFKIPEAQAHQFPDGFKVSMIAFRDDDPERRVLLDCHPPKGPHYHLGAIEVQFEWTGLKRADDLFWTLVEAEFVSTEFLNKYQDQRQDFIVNSLMKTYAADEVQTENFETFNTKDAVVWVDPLDGTSDFVKGNLPAVTVLIGLSINGKSRAGIIHNPFSFED